MSAIAEESKQVKRAREKLKKKIEDANRLVTPEALAKMTEEIHLWISKNIKERVDLKGKNISLFDENENVASVSSRYIGRLRTTIKRQLSGATKMVNLEDPSKQLRGRVSRAEAE